MAREAKHIRTIILVAVALALPLATPTPAATGAASAAIAYVNHPATGGVGGSAGEPSLGIDPATGNAFVQAGSQILRVSFDDSTSPASARWHNVASGLQALPNLDPIAATDPVTGRTFAGGLEGDCSVLSATDDDGETWTPLADACTAPAFDHPTVGSGPYHAPAPLAATYPRAVYYCAQGEAEQCAVSWDGGLTFNAPAVVTTTCLNAVGHIKVGPDGTAYVPAKNCGSTQAVMVSTDNGLTWTTRAIAPSTVSGGFNDPSVAISRDTGLLYAAWQGKDLHVRAATSADQGRTWSPATDLGAAFGLQSGSYAAAVAGTGGRAAVAFLGSADAQGFSSSFAGTWDLYVATTLEGGQTWTTVKATTDPVQRGWICDSGTTCGSGRNLLDFIDANLDGQGRVLVVYADGCVDACAAPEGTAAESTTALATIARQACGPSLLAEVGDLPGACPVGAPPAPPALPLVGTLYAHGTAPVGNPDGLLGIALPGDTLTRAPPAPGAPKAYSNGAGEHGSNAGTVWDAHWTFSGAGDTYALSDATVTVHLWVTTEPVAPATATTLHVSLYDSAQGDFTEIYDPVASQLVSVPATGGLQEVVATFPHVSATLQHGLELWVDDVDGVDTQAWYDSPLTPTSVTIA